MKLLCYHYLLHRVDEQHLLLKDQRRQAQPHRLVPSHHRHSTSSQSFQVAILSRRPHHRENERALGSGLCVGWLSCYRRPGARVGTQAGRRPRRAPHAKAAAALLTPCASAGRARGGCPPGGVRADAARWSARGQGTVAASAPGEARRSPRRERNKCILPLGIRPAARERLGLVRPPRAGPRQRQR